MRYAIAFNEFATILQQRRHFAVLFSRFSDAETLAVASATFNIHMYVYYEGDLREIFLVVKIHRWDLISFD